MTFTLEIACFSPKDATIAAEAGADRIELCRNYSVGGLTPLISDLAEVKKHVRIPVFVMIRERAGEFRYTSEEVGRMCQGAEVLVSAGADGIVFGALDQDRQIDVSALNQLVEAVSPVPVTFHRAFDEVQDQFEGQRILADYGVSRVLTSGRKSSALEDVEHLQKLVALSADTMTVIPGGGIRASNAREILETTKALEIHSSARTTGNHVDACEVKRLANMVH